MVCLSEDVSDRITLASLEDVEMMMEYGEYMCVSADCGCSMCGVVGVCTRLATVFLSGLVGAELVICWTAGLLLVL